MSYKLIRFSVFIFFSQIGKILSVCPEELSVILCDIKNNENETAGTKNYAVKISEYCRESFMKKEVNSDCNELEKKLSLLNLYNLSHVCEEINTTDEKILIDEIVKSLKWLCNKSVNLENIYNTTQWGIASIYPTEAFTNTETEVVVTLISMEMNSTDVWCFFRTPDNNTEIVAAYWVKENRINCSRFIPTVSGVYIVGVDSLEGIHLVENVSLKVFGKPPEVEAAEYSSDLKNIYVHFNKNIQLLSDCNYVFSKNDIEHFGTGFSCKIRGNILVVKLGFDFKPLDNIELVSSKSIVGLGQQGPEFLPAVLPTIMPISNKKVLSPSLSIYIDSDCNTNEKNKYLTIKSVAFENINHDTFHKTFKSRGKSHREHLILWRNIRQLQHKLPCQPLKLQIDSNSMLPNFESLAFLEHFNSEENPLGFRNTTGGVSVVIKSLPAPSSIIAEANFTFCSDNITLFRYKWLVNDEITSEDGKLLIVKDLQPGKYIITCLILDYNSTEILTQGWTAVEIHEGPEKVIISPSEIEMGNTDTIFLQAMPWRYKSTTWTCRTLQNNPCFTTTREIITDVVDIQSAVLSIPPGILPPGSYFWRVENDETATTAAVTIKPDNPPTVQAYLSSILVTSTEDFVLNVTAKNVKVGCRVWWTCIRRKGFEFIDLHNVGTTEIEILEEQQDISFIIPASDSSLQPDSSYEFKIQVACPNSGQISHIIVPVVVNDPPRISTIIVEPLSGKALITKFKIFQPEAVDSIEDYPLLFEWSYIDPCDNEIPIRRGAFPVSVITFLPPGDLRVTVRVCDVRDACAISSSSFISVSQTDDIPLENFEIVFKQIRYLMAAGDTSEAFALAITAFKTLTLSAESEIRRKAFETVQNAITAKIEDYTKSLETNSNSPRPYLKFYKQAQGIVKYYRKDSNISKILDGFKNFITNIPNRKREKRKSSSRDDQNVTAIGRIFKLHSSTLETNDTIQNRLELLKDVRKYMLKICSESLLNSFLIASTMVNISVSKVEEQSESTKIFRFSEGDNFILEISAKFLRQKTCLAVAEFSRDLLGNTVESRLTKVYEIQIIRKEKFLKNIRNNSTAMTMIYRIKNPPRSGVDCMTWSKTQGWTTRCIFKGSTKDELVCTCSDLGYHSTFLRYPPGRHATGSDSSPSTTHITIDRWDSCITFKIDENYKLTVGGNFQAFKEDLKRQVANQLNIPVEAISYFFIQEGSIMVTVFFIDVQNTKAETVMRDLVNKLLTNSLHLFSWNNTRLKVDPQNYEIWPRHNSSGTLRLITWLILAGSAALITIMTVAVIILRKKTRQATTGEPQVNQNPIYGRFYNEFSLNGSSASLAMYRRNSSNAESA